MAEIDLDEDIRSAKLTYRERIAVKLLLVAVQICLPTKYSHQWGKVMDDLKGRLNGWLKNRCRSVLKESDFVCNR